ncbi:TetR/AcrR family transcriptional regulator [Pseudonocardia sp. C8]|uniref:TetR/AcrR family transcriptional regulator n=1 Tax=Pseudonocardia sp. C8 TaxID=2762759 RepID=UPI00164272AC|nr:TetR/AcrR family transcriptional regulator [Pseudonocardia sp. C8]MBC3191353.1 TetR/AcrR family transcriptional regulator [Pseudonocardia sp. C8]
MPRASRKDDVLRAAEKVFAEHGYERATMRLIADEAGVRLPLVVYHFETKLNLYRSVFEAHQYLNEQRLERLRAVDLDAPDALDEIVAAFLSIGRVDRDDLRKQRYLRLVLREAGDPLSGERGIIADLFDPMAREFIAALETAVPSKPAGFHRWAYIFSVGALTMSNFDDRERALAAGASSAVDRIDFLQDYIVAALRHG